MRIVVRTRDGAATVVASGTDANAAETTPKPKPTATSRATDATRTTVPDATSTATTSATVPATSVSKAARRGDAIAERDPCASAPENRRRADAVPGLPPVLDALAAWAFAPETRDGLPVLRVVYERPMRYDVRANASTATIVVSTVFGYHIAFGDGANHLVIAPATRATREFASGAGHFTYRDVWFDPTTYVPTRVVLSAPGETLAIDYATVNGAWILADFSYDSRPELATERAALVGTYTDVTFPSLAPDI